MDRFGSGLVAFHVFIATSIITSLLGLTDHPHHIHHRKLSAEVVSSMGYPGVFTLFRPPDLVAHAPHFLLGPASSIAAPLPSVLVWFPGIPQTPAAAFNKHLVNNGSPDALAHPTIRVVITGFGISTME